MRKAKESKLKTSHKKSDPWDERQLGAEAEFVGVADESHEKALNNALELQSISIRLPLELIKNYKLIAGFHGIGYQPLMRDILHRFVPEGLKEITQQQSLREIKRAKTELVKPLVKDKKAA